MSFERVAKIDDLWSGEMIGLEANGQGILLVNVEGTVYAYSDACPHQKSRLSEGTLSGQLLCCARHQWQFNVCSGVGINPQNCCLKRFPIRVDGEDILVDTDAVISADAAMRGRIAP